MNKTYKDDTGRLVSLPSHVKVGECELCNAPIYEQSSWIGHGPVPRTYSCGCHKTNITDSVLGGLVEVNAETPIQYNMVNYTYPVDVMTIDEVAEKLKVSAQTVRKLIASKELKAITISPRTFRVRVSDYNKFLESKS